MNQIKVFLVLQTIESCTLTTSKNIAPTFGCRCHAICEIIFKVEAKIIYQHYQEDMVDFGQSIKCVCGAKNFANIFSKKYSKLNICMQLFIPMPCFELSSKLFSTNRHG